ncbi:NADPH-dependent oxidoreductase [bioreactor metagenome]|uniref:NADPH-dependent oxidoreductase n=1 Tax=bioreactor metagenome TaxID=1076179 RepID=A0A645JEP2_9ZZZZ
MSFYQLTKDRYSLRKFSDKPVEETVLNQILETGRTAPSAKNLQPHRIVVIQSPEALTALRGLTRNAFNAPVVLLLCGVPAEGWVNPFNQRNSTEMDVSIVTTQIMLQATELGLGTTWACWFDTEAVKSLLDLPAGWEPYVLLPLGYPAEDAKPSGQHELRKPLSETVIHK